MDTVQLAITGQKVSTKALLESELDGTPYLFGIAKHFETFLQSDREARKKKPSFYFACLLVLVVSLGNVVALKWT